MGKIGRPAIDDDVMLNCMADLIFRNPALLPTEAFRTCYEWRPWHQSEVAERKRLIRKFKSMQAELLAEAELRFYRPQESSVDTVITIPRFNLSSKLIASLNGFPNLMLPKIPSLGGAGFGINGLELPHQKLLDDMTRILEPIQKTNERISKAMEMSAKMIHVTPYELPKGLRAAIRIQARLPRVVVRGVQF